MSAGDPDIDVGLSYADRALIVRFSEQAAKHAGRNAVRLGEAPGL